MRPPSCRNPFRLACALILGLSSGLLPAAGGGAWASQTAATLRSLDVEQGNGGTAVTLRIDGAVSYKVSKLSNPPRLVLDLARTKLRTRSKRDLDGTQGITAVRTSQYKPSITRVVLDLSDAASPQITPIPSGLRIFIPASRGPARRRADDGKGVAVETSDSGPTAESPASPTKEVATPPAQMATTTPGAAPTNSGTVAGAAPTGDTSRTSSTARSIASITYITPSSVYVDAGSGDRIQVGDVLEVVRSRKTVAKLGVEHLSSRKAACRVLETAVELHVGDTVQFIPREDATSPAEDTSGRVSAASPVSASVARRSRSGPGWLRENGIRGRLGARYLTVVDRGGTGQDFSQPALDLRLDGRSIGGSAFDLSVDVRARQTYRTSSDGTISNDGRSRVYQAAGTWHPKTSLFNFTVGRQYSPDLATLSIFDGAAATLRFSHWSIGALSGTQPDPVDYGYSQEIRDSGGFLQISSSQAPADRWYVTLGMIGSYVAGEINREFVTLQASYSHPRFSTYVSQDVDLNRGWRREVEGSTHTLTNTYVSSRWRATEGLSLHAGYDNRRNVRLYRDFESPETEFDDAHRQGFWGGVAQRFARYYRVGLDAKRATGGSSGNADAYTLTLAAQWRVHASLRSTYFTNQLADGWMHSGLLGAQVLSWTHVEIGGGMRDESSNIGLTQQGALTWMHFALDQSLGRHWYTSLSAERSKEGVEANDQYYVSTNYRF